jgi:hypothetical protein
VECGNVGALHCASRHARKNFHEKSGKTAHPFDWTIITTVPGSGTNLLLGFVHNAWGL